MNLSSIENDNTCYQLVCFTDCELLSELEFPEGPEKSMMPGFVSSGQVGAVFTKEDPAMFSGKRGEENMADLQWLLPRITYHQAITSWLSEKATVLPVRFGALYSDKVKLLSFVEQNRDAVLASISRLENTSEWDLKIYSDTGLLTSRLEQELLKEESKKLASFSSGKRYFHEQKLKKQVQGALELKIQELLLEVSREFAEVPVDAVQIRGAVKEEEKEKSLIGHQALLLENEKTSILKDKIQIWNDCHKEQGAFIKLSGPWPPYNFCPSFDSLSE